MEWLGILFLYLVSGFMKKRQQNAKRRQIESDPGWDPEHNFSEDITESPKTLKCGHIYHTKCIKEWKNKSMTCPMCRVRIIEPRRSVRSRLFGTLFYVCGLR
mgnify:CR=1 FL=1